MPWHNKREFWKFFPIVNPCDRIWHYSRLVVIMQYILLRPYCASYRDDVQLSPTNNRFHMLNSSSLTLDLFNGLMYLLSIYPGIQKSVLGIMSSTRSQKTNTSNYHTSSNQVNPCWQNQLMTTHCPYKQPSRILKSGMVRILGVSKSEIWLQGAFLSSQCKWNAPLSVLSFPFVNMDDKQNKQFSYFNSTACSTGSLVRRVMQACKFA